MQDLLTLILGGGRGTPLYPLTLHRSEPAVPLAGKYRLIDIPISNCLNSGMNRIYVLTQFLSVSLHRHIAQTYKCDPFGGGFVEVLAARQTNESTNWYEGTADALRQNSGYIERDTCTEILVLSGDQLYRMDFRLLLQSHRESRADVTIAVAPVAGERADRMGILRVDDDLRVVSLIEKPQSPEQLETVRMPSEWLRARGCDGPDREYLANMGIYLFSRSAFLDLLNSRTSATDLVRGILTVALASHRVHAYLFRDYWDDLGTVKSYYEAHLALAGPQPPFDFNRPEGVIFTHMRYLPASRVRGARVEDGLISDACEVGPGASLVGSVVGLRSRIGTGVSLHDTVLIGADFLETEAERADNRRAGRPDVGVGENSVIERAILDKNCRVGRGVRITNASGRVHADEELYVIRDGIVVIPKGTEIPDGTVI